MIVINQPKHSIIIIKSTIIKYLPTQLN